MTYSDHKKVYRQLKAKPVIWKKFLKHNAPKKRSCGVAQRKCSRCGRVGGHIRKYRLDYCRQCFREIAGDLGFKKFS